MIHANTVAVEFLENLRWDAFDRGAPAQGIDLLDAIIKGADEASELEDQLERADYALNDLRNVVKDLLAALADAEPEDVLAEHIKRVKTELALQEK